VPSLPWGVPHAQGNNLATVKTLLQLGARATARDASGTEPLAYAAMHPDSASVIKLLFKHHADTNAVDYLGQSAVLIAAKSGSDEAVAELITRRNLRPNIQDKKGVCVCVFVRMSGTCCWISPPKKCLLFRAVN